MKSERGDREKKRAEPERRVERERERGRALVCKYEFLKWEAQLEEAPCQIIAKPFPCCTSHYQAFWPQLMFCTLSSTKTSNPGWTDSTHKTHHDEHTGTKTRQGLTEPGGLVHKHQKLVAANINCSDGPPCFHSWLKHLIVWVLHRLWPTLSRSLNPNSTVRHCFGKCKCYHHDNLSVFLACC